MAEQQPPKKRSTYKPKDILELPSGVDKKKYGYRWLSNERLGANSDGYDPRGYELHKDAEGKPVRRGDLILGRMPIDEYTDMKEQKAEDAKNQMSLVLERQAAELDRDSHEFRKKGGKVKFNFEQN